MDNRPIVLEIKSLRKQFPGVLALDGVDFTLRAGQIHGLMGENGAGKSTLIKAVTGVFKPDEGSISFLGKPFAPHSAHQATSSGLSTVYQEINLIPTLSVAENIFLGRQPMKNGKLDWKTINEKSESILQTLDLTINVNDELSSFPIAIQQMVAIARALLIDAKVLILDEPTSSLDNDEVTLLFKVMRKLKEKGLGILFVSHFIDQVYEITDTITVLRNGGFIGEYPTDQLSRLDLISKMLGKELSSFEAQGSKTGNKNVSDFMKADKIGRTGCVNPMDLEIRSGEVTGLAGLLGSGRTELARLLFGLDKPSSGTLTIKRMPTKFKSPRQAIKAHLAFCPEDRKVEGLFPDMTIRENIIMALQVKKGLFKTINKTRQNEIAEKYIKDLAIKTPSAERAISALSGGNQQKVILARWLASDPELLILDEPTRGIDVGAKVEIQKRIIELASAGMAVVFISSEIDEIIRCADKVIVLDEHEKIAELYGKDINTGKILEIIASGDSDAAK